MRHAHLLFSVHGEAWPEADAGALKDDRADVVIQVDGRVVGTVVVSVDADQETVVQAARGGGGGGDGKGGGGGGVFVENRLVNFVTDRWSRSSAVEGSHEES